MMDFYNIKKLIDKYIKNKRNLTFIFILVVGIVFLLLPTEKQKSDEKKTDLSYEVTELKEEKRLEKILSSVDGIKKVRVMICFYDKGVKEYYKNESEDRDEKNMRSDKKMVLTKNEGNEEPVLKRELSPDIKGVSIVADCKAKGMEDVIYRLTSKALGVDIHKIEVIINDRS